MQQQLSFTPPPPSLLRLLVCDLDGTLLDSATKRLPPCNISAIRSLPSYITFAPATGKSRVGALRALSPLQLPTPPPGVFLNGLYVHNGVRTIHEHFLPHPALHAAIHVAERNGLVVLLYHGDEVFVRERRKETDMFIISHEPTPQVFPFDSPTLPPIHKALVVDPLQQIGRYRPDFQRVPGVAVTQARPDVLEIMPEGHSKRTGLVKLLQFLGVQQQCVMACGDAENDVEMLEFVACGVAMKHGVERAKQVADWQADSVAEAVHTFILGQ